MNILKKEKENCKIYRRLKNFSRNILTQKKIIMKLVKDFLSVRNSIFPLIQVQCASSKRNYIAITFDENNSLPYLLNHNNQDQFQIQSPSTNTIISRKIHDEYEIAYVKACDYIEKNQQFFLRTGQKNFNSTYELLGKAVFQR